MKFKLDENIGRRGVELLKASGHDVMTVWDQGLRGITDKERFEICSAERRALVTLDRDFGQIPRFPPEKSAGIVILEVGPKTTLEEILDRLREPRENDAKTAMTERLPSWRGLERISSPMSAAITRAG